MNQQILAQLQKYAVSDLNLAKKEQDISMCQTKKGTVTIVYNEANKTWSFFTCDMWGNETVLLAEADKKTAVDYIVNELFDIVD